MNFSILSIIRSINRKKLIDLILRKTANYWVPVVVVLTLVVMVCFNLNFTQDIRFEDHFAPRWSAAREWMREGWSPYSEETQQATLSLLRDNKSYADKVSKGNFLDPVWYIFLYIPISFIPYPVAKAIWITLLQVSVAVSIHLALELSGLNLSFIEKFITVLLGVLFYVFVRDYIAASMLPFFMMLSLLGVKFALDRQSVQAGFLFLLAVWVNPVSIFLIIFLLIVLGGRRDNAMLRMLIVGFGFLMLTSLILFPGWISQWFAKIVLLEPDLDWLNTPWMGIANLFPGSSTQISIILHIGSFIMLLVEWYGLSRMGERALQWKLMLTLTVAYFFNLYSDGSALLLILPGAFTISKYLSEKWPIAGKIIHWISYLMIGFLSWRLADDPLKEIPEAHGVLLLLAPLLVFVGLQWFRWWAVASPKALVESNKITG
jgi:hypothetical protein